MFDRCDIILRSNSTEQDIGIVATELVIILHVCAMAAESSTFMFCHKVWEGCRRGKNVEVRFPSQLIQRDRGKHLQPSPVLISKYRHGNSWQGELLLGFEGRLVFLTSLSEENALFHVCPKTRPRRIVYPARIASRARIRLIASQIPAQLFEMESLRQA